MADKIISVGRIETMARKRIYVGVAREMRSTFSSAETPTEASGYAYVIGPFRTMRGALFMRDRGQGNPHVQTVADAERIAKAINYGS